MFSKQHYSFSEGDNIMANKPTWPNPQGPDEIPFSEPSEPVIAPEPIDLPCPEETPIPLEPPEIPGPTPEK